MTLATLFQLTVPGAPGLYYGDEVAMTGGHDPANRGAFPSDGGDPAHLERVRSLLSVRRRRPSLRTGWWRLLAHDADAFAYERLTSPEDAVAERTVVGSTAGRRRPRFRWPASVSRCGAIGRCGGTGGRSGSDPRRAGGRGLTAGGGPSGHLTSTIAAVVPVRR